MDSEDPIYQFDHFKSLLSAMGIEVEKPQLGLLSVQSKFFLKISVRK